MPKIVDKVTRRKDIAKSTCSLFIQNGFVNISISQIAKVAGIGKGTIYEYFKNKEDIVFELMCCLQEDYDPKLAQNLLYSKDTKAKVIALFDIFLSDTDTIQTQRDIYKEFLAIYLSNPSDDIDKFYQKLKQKYAIVLTDILEEAVKKGEISEIAIKFVSSIFATVEGFFIAQEDRKENIINYIDNLFILLENKNR